MKKKLLWAIFSVLVLLVATAGVTVGDTATPEAKSLSLSQVIEMAMKENSQVELAVLGVEKADLSVERAELAKKKLLDAMDNPDRRDQNAAMVVDVQPVLAQNGKVIADTTKEYTENSIKFGVESAYYGVLRAGRNLETAKASLQRAKEQLKQAQAKFNAGTVAKIDVISAESQVMSAEVVLREAESGLQKANMGLNQALNLNVDTPLKLTDSFSYEPAEEIDPEKVIQEMMEKDLSYVAAHETYKGNQALFDYYTKYFTPHIFDYREAAYNFKEAEVNLNHAKSSLQINVKAAYLDLKTYEANYQSYLKSVEIVKEAYRLAQLRYDVGMATGYDVLSAETALMQADLGLLNALYNYNLAKAKFTYGIF